MESDQINKKIQDTYLSSKSITSYHENWVSEQVQINHMYVTISNKDQSLVIEHINQN